jgi:hypothetical protein
LSILRTEARDAAVVKFVVDPVSKTGSIAILEQRKGRIEDEYVSLYSFADAVMLATGISQVKPDLKADYEEFYRKTNGIIDIGMGTIMFEDRL